MAITTTTVEMGKIEISIADIDDAKLSEFLDFVAYSAELMGYEMVGRAYMETETIKEDEEGNLILGEETDNAEEETESVKKR